MTSAPLPSEWAFWLCLSLAVGILFYQFAQPRREPGADQTSLVAVIGAPLAIALCGCLVVASAEPSGDIRLSVSVLEFSRSPDRHPAFSVGGDSGSDELVVGGITLDRNNRMPGGLLRVQQGEEGRASIFVRRTPTETTRPAIVQTEDRIIGATRFDTRSALCLGDCNDERVRHIFFDETRNALRFSSEAPIFGPEMRRRDPDVPGVRLRDYGPRTRIYPLRHYLPEDPALQNRDGLHSFLYRSQRGELFFVDLDEEIQLSSASGARETEAADIVLCPAEQGCPSQARVRVFEVRIADTPPSEGYDGSSGFLSEIRSFVLEARRDRVVARLDTPIVLTLSRDALDQEEGRLAENNLSAQLLLRAGPPQPTPDQLRSTVHLSSLGGDFLGSIDQRLFPGRVEGNAPSVTNEGQGSHGSCMADAPNASVAVSDGNVICEVANGRTVQLGQETAAWMRIDQLDATWPPLLAAGWLILFGALLSLVATWSARRASVAHFALMTMVDVMLMMRVLIALSAAHTDGGVEARGAVADAFAVYLAFPLLLSFLFPSTYSPQRGLLILSAHGLGVAMGVYWSDRMVGPMGVASIMAFGAATAAMLIGVLGWAADRAKLRWPIPEIALQTRGFFDWRVWVGIVVLIAFGRVVLAAVGVREAFMIGGQRISLSIIYVPLAIAVFALILKQIQDDTCDPDQTPVFAFLVGFGLLTVGPLWFARDTGAVIYAIPVAILAHLIATRRQVGDGRWQRGFMCLLLYGGCLAGIVGLAMIVTGQPSADFLSFIRSNLWPLALGVVSLLLCLHVAVRRKRTLLAAPAVCLIAIIALVNLVQLTPSATESRIDKVVSTETQEDDLELLDSAWRYATNNLRILGLIDPDALTEIGTREAEGQGIAFAHMADHSRLLEGHGYLEAPAPAANGLLRFHMNDNVTSVHVMGPFGRLGAIVYLTLLFMALVLVAARVPKRRENEQNDTWASMVVVLSASTIVLVTAYMFLANIGAAPFTGRNAYLMAVNSMGDVAEAGVLFGIAILCALGDRSDEQA